MRRPHVPIQRPLPSALCAVHSPPRQPSLGRPCAHPWTSFRRYNQPDLTATDSWWEATFRGGEGQGLARLRAFISADLPRYSHTHNGLTGLHYSSKLSPWVSAGCVSPRRVVHEVRAWEATRRKGPSPSSAHFVSEFGWRDFLIFVALKSGASMFQLQGPGRVALPWGHDTALTYRLLQVLCPHTSALQRRWHRLWSGEKGLLPDFPGHSATAGGRTSGRPRPRKRRPQKRASLVLRGRPPAHVCRWAHPQQGPCRRVPPQPPVFMRKIVRQRFGPRLNCGFGSHIPPLPPWLTGGARQVLSALAASLANTAVAPQPRNSLWLVPGRGKGKVLGRTPNSSVTVIPTCPSQHPFRLAGSQTP